MGSNADMPIDPRLLGARLQEARKARRMTQQQAAENLGMARTTIVAIEKGERQVQDAELVQLARLYGREVNDLLRRQYITHSFAVQFRAVQVRDGSMNVDEQEKQVA